jgi:hypothetical protein
LSMNMSRTPLNTKQTTTTRTGESKGDNQWEAESRRGYCH